MSIDSSTAQMVETSICLNAADLTCLVITLTLLSLLAVNADTGICFIVIV